MDSSQVLRLANGGGNPQGQKKQEGTIAGSNQGSHVGNVTNRKANCGLKCNIL